MKGFLCVLPFFVCMCVFLVSCSDDNGTGPAQTWQMIFEDDFNSTNLNSNWMLAEGDENNYILNGSNIGMNDTDQNQDGALLLYKNTVTNNRIRMSCVVSTLAITGEVEFILILRAADEFNTYVVYVADNEVIIFKVLNGTESTLAQTNLPSWASNTTRVVTCEYNNGKISFTVRNTSGATLGSVTATDPSPLPAGMVGFMGEIDNSEGEYLYFDDFKLEKYE